VNDDAANEYIEKITQAQGVVLGSPVYFMDVTPEMKALIDRAGFVSRSNGGMYKNKVGALVAAARRTGAMHTLDTMSHFLMSMEMILVGRALGVGRDKGDVEIEIGAVQAWHYEQGGNRGYLDYGVHANSVREGKYRA